jgi:hypothetical protein
MKRVGLWMIGIGLFITAGLITVQQGHPTSHEEHTREQDKRAPTCTLKTLQGRYLFATSGLLFPPAFGVTEPTAAASAAGFHIFHGDGTATDIVTVRINAETVLENAVTTASYTVNADCTGTHTVPNGSSFGLFIAPTGEAVAFIGTDPGHQEAHIAQRVSLK